MTTADPGASVARRPSLWRRHRALFVLLALVSILLFAAGAWALYLSSRISDIDRFDVDLGSAGAGGRPDRSTTAALNILLVGVDDGQGTDLAQALDSETWPVGVFRSDAIMVLHLDADRSAAGIVSIPRDSYVDVDGYGRTKINAAFSFGGPELLVRTVEDLTGVFVDHVAVADLNGFAEITDAVGGVEVDVPDTQANRGDGLQPGLQRLDGQEALRYVRERSSLPNGDLDRVQRQQNVLRSIADGAASAGVLANPLRLTDLVGDIADSLSLSQSLTSGEVRELGLSLRGLRTEDLTFTTVPVTGTPTIDGASVVTLDKAALPPLFEALEDDMLRQYLARVGETDPLPAPGDVD